MDENIRKFFLRISETAYGFTGITQRVTEVQQYIPDIIIERPTIEDIMLITDFAQIAAYGVMTTPALVVDGKVVSYGKVLKAEEVKSLIQKARG